MLQPVAEHRAIAEPKSMENEVAEIPDAETKSCRPFYLGAGNAPTTRDVVARIDAVCASIRLRLGQHSALEPGETWRDLIDEGRRI